MSTLVYGGNAGATALTVAFDIHTNVEKKFYETRYPQHEWYDLIDEDQVIEDINPGATAHGYMTRDYHGTAAYIGNGSNSNIPFVGQSMKANQVPVAYAAIGAKITNEDARQFSYGFNANLSDDLAKIMRIGCDNLTEQTVIFGNKEIGFEGFINYSGLDVYTSPAGASGSSEFETKTPEELYNELCDYVRELWENSRKIFMCNAIVMPMKQYAILTSTPMVLNGVALAETVLSYFLRTNISYTLGKIDINVYPSRYLSNAGTGETGRMVFQCKEPDNQFIPFPMAYTMSAPVPDDLAAKLFAEQKNGGFVIRQKGSMFYVDGI